MKVHEERDKLELVCVPVKDIPGYGEIPNTNEFLEDVSMGFSYIEANRITQIPLESTLIVISKDNFFNDGSTSNKAIGSLTKNRSSYNWRGSIMVMKQNEPDVLVYAKFIDMDSTDNGDVVDYFNLYQ